MVYIYLWCTKSYTCVGVAPIGTHTYKTHENTARGQGIILVLQDKTANDAAHTSKIAHSDCHTAAQSTTHELHRA